MVINLGGGRTLDLALDTTSYRYRSIMGDNTLNLYFSSEEYIEIPVGATCVYQGITYELTDPDNFRKDGKRIYSYTLIMEDATSHLNRYKAKDPVSKRVKFPLTAKPEEHLQLIVDNLNMRESGWQVGNCIDATEKVIVYNHMYLIDALRQIADTFNTEWEIDSAAKIIHLKKVEYNKDQPLELSYGKGNGLKAGLTRTNDDKRAVNLLYVQGGTQNIDPSKYGNNELLLPKNKTLTYNGKTYVTDTYGLYVTRANATPTVIQEDSLDCSHIYPKRVGTVSSVITVDASKNFYDFVDSSIPASLDFNDCIIEGEKMLVIFQSGMLAGDDKRFECTYDHANRRFSLVPQEIDGVVMPNNTYKPATNDKYAVFNIQLPDAYVCDDVNQEGASWDMFREAARYLDENEVDKVILKGELDGIWSKRRWQSVGAKIKLGGYVLITDEDFDVNGSLIRIIGIRDYVHNPYSPQIEFSNSPISQSISTVLNKVSEDEVLTERLYNQAISFTKRRFRDAQETMTMLNQLIEAGFDHFTTAITPIAVQTMSMLVGDESLQFRFVNNKTTPVQVSHTFSYDKVHKQLSTGVGRYHTAHDAWYYKYKLTAYRK